MSDALPLLAQLAGRTAPFEWTIAGQASWSDAFLAQLGVSRDELAPDVEAFFARAHADDATHLRARIAGVIAAGSTEPFECEYRLRCANGEHRWFRAALQVARGGGSDAGCIAGAQVDVHALRSAEARLLTLNVELARVASAREDFLSSMSHELRTPLNAVLGQAQALTEGTFGPLTPAMRDALAVIATSGTHLLSLLNTVLDLARLEAGSLPLHREPVGVVAIAQEALHLVRPQARSKNVALEFRTVRCSDEDVAWLDRLRARQVLANLLSNAVKFSPGGRAVTLEARREDDAWAFTVADEGPGIERTDQLRLFHPFVQVDGGRTRRHDGAGLGLALVKRLLDLHGGSIELDSTPGSGSRFTARFPTPSAVDPAIPSPVPAVRTLKSVVIVDDTIINVEPLRRYLGRLGVDVRVAETGPDALALVAQRAPQVIFLDWHMPGMDGSEVIRRLRREPFSRDVRIITLTALVGDHIKEEALQLGADAFLAKPARLADAVALAESLVKNPRRQ
ncbi:MAG: response regulator [Myxococcaceae bacterium]|jgi:signal transduction histidine kinase/ActR/RegA family two-component response regulator|nr:response regulator [Myxococcaceae bacterium]MCA3013157.1 response regulator [Myxococcaceae bacterium]